MKQAFEQYITKTIECSPLGAGAGNIVFFCHFDADNIIAPYVVHYLKALKDASCDVVFITNSNPDETQLTKIQGVVNRIIIRQNIGYDFAAYFTGYALHRNILDKYKNFIFVNDSAIGPFYPLGNVFAEMQAKNLDMWGISDAFYKHYHIQSYFWAFYPLPPVLKILDEEANNYNFHLPKKDVVAKYEEGITAKFLRKELKLGVLCPNSDAIAFEMTQTDDAELIQLKKDMVRIAKAKQSVGRKIKALFSVKAKRHLGFTIPDANAYLTGMNSCWYSMIKYFRLPFIKVSLLKGQNNFRYHGFRYIGLVKQAHPQYDTALIEEHLNRIKGRKD